MSRFFLFFVLGLFLASCGNDKKYEELNKYWWIYEQARSVGDDATAVNAVYEIMYLDSNEYIYFDTLATLFFEMGQYERCMNSSKKSLRYHTYPQTVRFGFESAKKLGLANEVVLFGDLLLQNEPTDLIVQYDLAVYSLRAQNFEAARQWIDGILANPNARITQHRQTQNDGSVINVPLSVCVTNLAGVYYWQTAQPQLAGQMFEQAILQVPNYDVAKENLKQLRIATAE